MNVHIPGNFKEAQFSPKQKKAYDAMGKVMFDAMQATSVAEKYDNVDGFDSNPAREKVQLDADILKGFIEYTTEGLPWAMSDNMDVQFKNESGETVHIKQITVGDRKNPEKGIFEYNSNEIKDFKAVMMPDQSMDITMEG